MRSTGKTRIVVSKIAGIGVLIAGFLLAARLCFGGQADPSQIPSIFKPQSTPADSIFRLSMLVLTITGAIFAVVFSLLVYAISKYRRRGDDDGREPPQVYGSNQVELAWTVIPVLIVLVLFLVTARVIHSIQDAPQPPGAIELSPSAISSGGSSVIRVWAWLQPMNFMCLSATPCIPHRPS
jgi:heme/copper-type cytochrome/quinol oxidase subunit 2